MTTPTPTGIERAAAEAWALDRVKHFGYEWGVLPTGEVIPFWVMPDGHSPKPPIDPNSWAWWHWTDTHPQWMECYVVFETWQALEEP